MLNQWTARGEGGKRMKSIGRRRKGSLNCRKYWGERAAFHLTPIGSNKSYVFRGFYHGPRDFFAVTTLPLFSHIPLWKPKFYRAPRVFERAPKVPIIRLTIEIICSIYTLLRACRTSRAIVRLGAEIFSKRSITSGDSLRRKLHEAMLRTIETTAKGSCECWWR